MGEHKRAAAKSLIWTTLESFGLSGLSFVSLIVLARFLAPADFGAVAIALGLVQILNVLVETTLHDALVQREKVTALHFDTAFTWNVGLGAALAFACWLGAAPFAALVGEPRVADLLPWLGLSLPAMALGSTLIPDQRRRMEFRPLAIRSLAGRSGGAVLGIALAAAGAGAWSLVVQQVASVALATLVLWIFATRRPRLRFSTAAFRQLIGFGVRTMANNLLFLSIPRVFVIGLGALIGAEATGFINIAFRTVDMLRDLAAGAILQLSLPIFSRLQNDPPRLAGHYVAAVEMACVAMFPVFVGLAVCAPEVVELVFGARWLPAAPYVALLAVLALHYFLRMFSAPLAAAVGRPHYSLVSAVFQLLFVAVGLLLVGGSAAAAMAVWALRIVFSTPIDMWMLARASGITPWRQVRGAVPILAASLAMAALVLALKLAIAGEPVAVRLAAMVSLGAAVYVGLLLVTQRKLVEEVLGLALAMLRRRPI